MSEDYIRALKTNAAETQAYYRKSIVKTEQQKALEALLAASGRRFTSIADIACGGGTLSYHLRELYSDAQFTLVDYNDEALAIARDLVPQCRMVRDDLYTLDTLADASFDLVCCWQTLSFINEPEKALRQLLRITRPGGMLYLSSLFNLHHDVDVYSTVYDYTRQSGRDGIPFSYNTYSAYTVQRWLDGAVKAWTLHDFRPQVDFTHDGRGLGTWTIRNEAGDRLQLSGGMVLNWAILEIER